MSFITIGQPISAALEATIPVPEKPSINLASAQDGFPKYAIMSSAILAFSSFILGYIINAIFPSPINTNDNLMNSLQTLDPLILILILFLIVEWLLYSIVGFAIHQHGSAAGMRPSSPSGAPPLPASPAV